MRLVWLTDIHLDFCDLDDRLIFYAKVAACAPDAVVITGDISNGRSGPFLKQMHDRVQKPIYFVLGNHDFYDTRIQLVRDEMDTICQESGYRDDLFYLPHHAEPIELAPNVALVGVDGWADGGYGNWLKSTVWLNDYELIRDLAPHSRSRQVLQMKLREIAASEAVKLRYKLQAALPKHSTVIVATHVPPFAEAAWHEGKQSDPNYLPHFSSKFIGDCLAREVAEHGHQRTLVLCGHTHGAGQCQPEFGMRVWTGAAEYRKPSIAAVLEVTSDRVEVGSPYTSF